MCLLWKSTCFLVVLLFATIVFGSDSEEEYPKEEYYFGKQPLLNKNEDYLSQTRKRETNVELTETKPYLKEKAKETTSQKKKKKSGKVMDEKTHDTKTDEGKGWFEYDLNDDMEKKQSEHYVTITVKGMVDGLIMTDSGIVKEKFKYTNTDGFKHKIKKSWKLMKVNGIPYSLSALETAQKTNVPFDLTFDKFYGKCPALEKLLQYYVDKPYQRADTQIKKLKKKEAEKQRKEQEVLKEIENKYETNVEETEEKRGFTCRKPFASFSQRKDKKTKSEKNEEDRLKKCDPNEGVGFKAEPFGLLVDYATDHSMVSEINSGTVTELETSDKESEYGRKAGNEMMGKLLPYLEEKMEETMGDELTKMESEMVSRIKTEISKTRNTDEFIDIWKITVDLAKPWEEEEREKIKNYDDCFSEEREEIATYCSLIISELNLQEISYQNAETKELIRNAAIVYDENFNGFIKDDVWETQERKILKFQDYEEMERLADQSSSLNDEEQERFQKLKNTLLVNILKYFGPISKEHEFDACTQGFGCVLTIPLNGDEAVNSGSSSTLKAMLKSKKQTITWLPYLSKLWRSKNGKIGPNYGAWPSFALAFLIQVLVSFVMGFRYFISDHSPNGEFSTRTCEACIFYLSWSKMTAWEVFDIIFVKSSATALLYGFYRTLTTENREEWQKFSKNLQSHAISKMGLYWSRMQNSVTFGLLIIATIRLYFSSPKLSDLVLNFLAVEFIFKFDDILPLILKVNNSLKPEHFLLTYVACGVRKAPKIHSLMASKYVTYFKMFLQLVMCGLLFWMYVCIGDPQSLVLWKTN